MARRELGFRSVHASDVSEMAVQRLRERYPTCKVAQLDIGDDGTADDTFDLAGVSDVTFSGGSVTVDDIDARADEVILALEIASDAAPGPVDVFVVSGNDAVLLVDGFLIDAVSATSGSSCASGSTGGTSGE